MDRTEIKAQLKNLIVERLKLKIEPASIHDEAPLFEAGDGSKPGLGLDSIEVLALVVAVEEQFEIKVENDLDPKTFSSVEVIGDYVHAALGRQVRPA